MASPVLVGREATHGTEASAFISVPCGFKPKLDVKNIVAREMRTGQDIHFSVVPGHMHEVFEVEESNVYHDTFGMFLMSATGLPVSTLVEAGVWDSVFKLLDDPVSLSFKWRQRTASIQPFKALYGVVDKLALSFEADGGLTYTASGVAMPEATVTAPTYSFSTTRPFASWQGAVTFQAGAYAKLVSGKVAISRSRKPHFVINNTQNPASLEIGDRFVEVDLVCDFASMDEYNDVKNGATEALLIKWEDAAVTIGATSKPALTVDIAQLVFESGEVDDTPDTPQIKLSGKALYDSGDASKIVWTLRSSRQYQIV